MKRKITLSLREPSKDGTKAPELHGQDHGAAQEPVLTDSIFYTLFGAASEEEDRERYIAEWSTSSLWDEEPETKCVRIPSDYSIADMLGDIWDVAHLSVRDLRKSLSMTQVEFAKHMCVSLRAVCTWENENRCQPYVRLLLAEHFGVRRFLRVPDNKGKRDGT